LGLSGEVATKRISALIDSRGLTNNSPQLNEDKTEFIIFGNRLPEKELVESYGLMSNNMHGFGKNLGVIRTQISTLIAKTPKSWINRSHYEPVLFYYYLYAIIIFISILKTHFHIFLDCILILVNLILIDLVCKNNCSFVSIFIVIKEY